MYIYSPFLFPSCPSFSWCSSLGIFDIFQPLLYTCVVVNNVDTWKWGFRFSIISIKSNIWEGDCSHLLLCVYKVEDADDIQHIPATIAGGAEAKEQSSTHQDVKKEAVQETSASRINTSELPPRVVLEMPALSPTMVTNLVFRCFKLFGFPC